MLELSAVNEAARLVPPRAQRAAERDERGEEAQLRLCRVEERGGASLDRI